MYEDEEGYYGVATISRLLQIIGLFCKRALQKRRYSTKETYNFKEPTNRSHPISMKTCISMYEDEEGSYRVAKTHRIPYLYRSFSAKVTYI